MIKRMSNPFSIFFLGLLLLLLNANFLYILAYPYIFLTILYTPSRAHLWPLFLIGISQDILSDTALGGHGFFLILFYVWVFLGRNYLRTVTLLPAFLWFCIAQLLLGCLMVGVGPFFDIVQNFRSMLENVLGSAILLGFVFIIFQLMARQENRA